MHLQALWDLIPATVTPRYIGDIQSTVKEGTTLLQSNFSNSIRYLGMSTEIKHPVVTFISRCADYSKGAANMQAIIDALKGQSIVTENILAIYCTGNYIYLGRNAEKVHEFQVSFELTLKE